MDKECMKWVFSFWWIMVVTWIILPDSNGAPLSEKACSQAPLTMSCPHGVKRQMYRWDNSKKECSTYSYKGCGGNSNKFETKKECENKCGIHGKSARKVAGNNTVTASVKVDIKGKTTAKPKKPTDVKKG